MLSIVPASKMAGFHFLCPATEANKVRNKSMKPRTPFKPLLEVKVPLLQLYSAACGLGSRSFGGTLPPRYWRWGHAMKKLKRLLAPCMKFRDVMQPQAPGLGSGVCPLYGTQRVPALLQTVEMPMARSLPRPSTFAGRLTQLQLSAHQHAKLCHRP